MYFANYNTYAVFRGRWALRLFLEAYGVSPNDSVICQAYTCTAVPEAISSIGALPLFVDTAPNSVNMCPDLLDAALSKNKDISCVVLQYTFGSMQHREALISVCKKYSIPFVEDCCHLPLSQNTLNILGDRGIAKFFSFEWGKPLPAGVGGALLVSNTHANLISKLDASFSKFKLPPLKTRIVLQFQFFLFKFLYRPRFYFFIKKVFHLFSKLGLVVGNHGSESSPINHDEMDLKMSPEVLFRLERSDLNVLDRSIREISSHNRRKINEIGLHELDNSDFLMRSPILVDDKYFFLQMAESISAEVGDWYESCVDPYPDDVACKLNWDVSNCSNARRLSSSVITIPLLIKHDVSYFSKLKSLKMSLK